MKGPAYLFIGMGMLELLFILGFHLQNNNEKVDEHFKFGILIFLASIACMLGAILDRLEDRQTQKTDPAPPAPTTNEDTPPQ